MKKLFIITDIASPDGRAYLKDRIIGTVVRAEVSDPGLDPYEAMLKDQLFLREDREIDGVLVPGWSSGVTFQDSSIWYDFTGPQIESLCHLNIRVKPLQ